MNAKFKFNYETCTERLEKELAKELSKLRGNAPEKIAKESGFDVMPRIWKDVCVKRPDIFIWIICSRDLSGMNVSDRKRIVNWKPLLNFRRIHAYKTDRNFLVTVDLLLQILQQVRPFSISTAEIETNGDFPSIYHFRICEFQGH